MAQVNGDPTDYAQWRGTVAVRSAAGLCSGVVIDHRVLLSAAHWCVLEQAARPRLSSPPPPLWGWGT